MTSLNINDDAELKIDESEEVLDEKSHQVAAPGSYQFGKSQSKSKPLPANKDARAGGKSEKGEFAKFCAQRSLPTKIFNFFFLMNKNVYFFNNFKIEVYL